MSIFTIILYGAAPNALDKRERILGRMSQDIVIEIDIDIAIYSTDFLSPKRKSFFRI
ncbi:MAG: hypothetical protein ABFC86_04330 [Rectinema sp.]